MLQAGRTPPKLVNYRGVLTPQSLDAPEAETAALLTGAAIHDMGWMRRVAVRGEDRFRWLSGMITNTVNDLFPHSGAWNFALNPQGHIQGDLCVWRGTEEQSPARRKTEVPGSKSASASEAMTGTPFAGESSLELEIAANQFDKLLAHFNQFIIMDQVELVPLGAEHTGEAGSETAIGLTGPQAEEVFSRAGLEVVLTQPMSSLEIEWNGIDLRIYRTHSVLAPHYEIFLPSAFLKKLWSCLVTAGATRVGSEALNALRIAESVPLYSVDIAERDLAQEISQSRAIHFNKGCYMGQEIVERVRSRGGVHRHLRPLELSGAVPAAGAALKLEDGSEAGCITSAAELKLASGSRTFALAMLRSQAEKPGLALNYSEGTARILDTPPNFKFKA